MVVIEGIEERKMSKMMDRRERKGLGFKVEEESIS